MTQDTLKGATQYVVDGTRVTPINTLNANVQPALYKGNYLVKVDSFGSFYLEIVPDFEVNQKIYGGLDTSCTRILCTFLDRNVSTGALLIGEKGSGKSLLAKLIASAARKLHNIPTILINTPYVGDKFNDFIRSIASSQPTIVLFDEFEKVYDRDEQRKLLTLLDGVFPSSILFILTCNDSYRLDSHLINRPGRLFYRLEFNGISETFINEYCKDNLKDLSKISGLLKIYSYFPVFSIDMLKALVEEMNRYGETAEQSLRMLNITAIYDDEHTYSVSLFVNGLAVPEHKITPLQWTGNLMLQDTFEVTQLLTGTNTGIAEDGCLRVPPPMSQAAIENAKSSYLDSNGDKVHVFKYYQRVSNFSNAMTVFRNDEGTEVHFTLKQRRELTYVY